MVMMMTNTTMKKPPVPLDVPVLPSADDYRDGMNKMRAKINCPVLSADEQVMADELREFDWDAPAHDDYPHGLRPSVDEYLKQQYQACMLARYPDFEAQTASDITALKHEISRLSDVNKVMVLLVLSLIVMLTITQTN